MTIPLLSPYYVQQLCLCSFMHKELAKAEIKTQHGIGQKIIDDGDYVRGELLKIVSYWHKKGLVMKNAYLMAKKSRKAKQYLMDIQNTIDFIIENNKEAFKYEEDTTMTWIPAYFTLTILKRLDKFNFRYYPDDVNISELIEAFENVQTISKNEKLVYWKLARLILQKLNYLEK